jgi:hypothetical protein
MSLNSCASFTPNLTTPHFGLLFGILFFIIICNLQFEHLWHFICKVICLSTRYQHHYQSPYPMSRNIKATLNVEGKKPTTHKMM